MYADISYYEQHPGFSEIRRLILRLVLTVCRMQNHLILSGMNVVQRFEFRSSCIHWV